MPTDGEHLVSNFKVFGHFLSNAFCSGNPSPIRLNLDKKKEEDQSKSWNLFFLPNPSWIPGVPGVWYSWPGSEDFNFSCRATGTEIWPFEVKVSVNFRCTCTNCLLDRSHEGLLSFTIGRLSSLPQESPSSLCKSSLTFEISLKESFLTIWKTLPWQPGWQSALHWVAANLVKIVQLIVGRTKTPGKDVRRSKNGKEERMAETPHPCRLWPLVQLWRCCSMSHQLMSEIDKPLLPLANLQLPGRNCVLSQSWPSIVFCFGF